MTRATAASDSGRMPLTAPSRVGLQLLASRLPQAPHHERPRLPVPRLPERDALRLPAQRGSSALRLPLYHRPGSVVLLDDVPDYLEMLVAALPRHWNIESFVKPQACVNFLQQEPPRWEADLWTQQRLVENWHKGTPLIRQILDYWAGNPERYALTKVCVFDQLMPGMTGLEALDELVDWPGHRILLTGDFDEGLATEAFNRGLIDQFIGKQTDNLAARLAEAIQMLMSRPNPRFHQIWSATLTPAQMAILREPSVADDLANFASTTFAEWVVIGDPFGILGISDGGVPFWLQLQPASSLDALAELAGQHGASSEDIKHIRAGRCVYDLQLRQSVGGPKPPSVMPAFYVGDAGILLAAIHRIDSDAAPAASLSYRDWLARQTRSRSMNQSRF